MQSVNDEQNFFRRSQLTDWDEGCKIYLWKALNNHYLVVSSQVYERTFTELLRWVPLSENILFFCFIQSKLFRIFYSFSTNFFGNAILIFIFETHFIEKKLKKGQKHTLLVSFSVCFGFYCTIYNYLYITLHTGVKLMKFIIFELF